MTDPSPSSEDATVAAILAARSRDDQNELLDDLVALLADTVTGAEVERSLVRRRVTSLRLRLGDYVYTLRKGAHGAFESLRQQEVAGVVIRTTSMDIELFLAELGLALDVELRRTERGRKALQAWLSPPNP
ncbi:MAG: hypothetical protein ABJC26_13475 [Gemmatimonadaceae bacterium]